MDNKVFNVNGRSIHQLKQTLKLALTDEYGDIDKVGSWEIDKEHGFILNSISIRGNKFPIELPIEFITDIVWNWLHSEDAKKMNFEGWDDDADHDGHNELGFRVYCDDWGHVGYNHYALVAIRPAYCWYGK